MSPTLTNHQYKTYYFCTKLLNSNKVQPSHSFVRFQVLMAASMKFRDFWEVEPCGHVEVDRRFRVAYCLHHQDRSPW
jgi:hypothetical protein